jgi:hypothetical protein
VDDGNDPISEVLHTGACGVFEAGPLPSDRPLLAGWNGNLQMISERRRNIGFQ